MKQALMLISVILVFVIPVTSFAGDCGDVDNSGAVNILDVTFLINYLYKGGPAPDPLDMADVNNDDIVNILDITYLISYLYLGGPEPDCGPQTGTVTDIDGNIYQTIKIGDQWWMMENLKVTHYRNGDPIPNVTDGGTWSGLTTGAYCEYDNDPGNVATYGRLYNWFAVDDSRNIAPEGWHVPTDAEWIQLEMHLGMSQMDADAEGWRGTDEGGKLKEAGTTHWNSPNTGATNESGFTALPGGYRGYNGDYIGMGFIASFWSSSEDSGVVAWGRGLGYDGSQVYRDISYLQSGFSIRCVRD